MKKRLCVILCFFMLPACSLLSSSEKKTEVSLEVVKQRKEKQKKLFQKGVDALDSEEYKKAALIFEKFLKKYPASSYEFMGLYNLGAAYEGMGHCGAAANRYRRVLKYSKGKNHKIKARSLLRLSYMYECLGKDSLVIASLVDLLKKSQYLPKESAQAEVPARLAAAYLRVGNRKEAKKYFLMAQKGLKILNRTTLEKKKKRELMARTFFYMGDLTNARLKQGFELKYIEHISSLQVYLLRSVELNVEKWSLLSANQILKAYDRLIEPLEQDLKSVKKETHPSKKHKMHTRVERIGVKLLEAIESLITQRFPDEKEPYIVKKLFLEVDQRKKRVQIILASLGPINVLTPEARRRKELLRPKKTMDVQ